jgi:hypothetical protein
VVEDRLSDGKRIAELLSSELTGLAAGPLEDVAVTDANPDVEPTDEGPMAYGITYEGNRVATVSVMPAVALLALEESIARSVDLAAVIAEVDHPDVAPGEADQSTRLRIESGAGVKATVDVLRTVLSATN